jgi:hypothetical protein
VATSAATPTRSDSAIRDDVLFEMKWDPKITSPDIGVAVKDGVVTLTGFVSSYWEKDAAEKAAKRVYGVRAGPTISKSSSRIPEPTRKSQGMLFMSSTAMSGYQATRSR